MFCDVCNTKEATIFLTQMTHGHIKKVNLCASCSKAQGVDDPLSFALTDLLSGLEANDKIAHSSLSCPVCGFSQSDFKKRGRLGCSACYDIFIEGLSVMLPNLHRGIVHTGKVPIKIAQAYARASQLEELQKSLAHAISKEHYEHAAHYRDLLEELKKNPPDNLEKKVSPRQKKIDSPIPSKADDLLL